MEQKDLEKDFTLISLAGTAKSLVYEAMDKASEKKFDEAEEDLKQADEILAKTHDLQSDDIQKMVNGDDSQKINLIDLHTQDHLMSAQEVRSLADVIIKLYRQLWGIKNE